MGRYFGRSFFSQVMFSHFTFVQYFPKRRSIISLEDSASAGILLRVELSILGQRSAFAALLVAFDTAEKSQTNATSVIIYMKTT